MRPARAAKPGGRPGSLARKLINRVGFWHNRRVLTREIDPAALRDIDKFEKMLALYLAGDLDEDRFRIFRLNNGIYGQRQGGHNQMVRVKIPYGSMRPDPAQGLAPTADG